KETGRGDALGVEEYEDKMEEAKAITEDVTTKMYKCQRYIIRAEHQFKNKPNNIISKKKFFRETDLLVLVLG
ncbi:24833_t:CDS:2, partial [Entrophospora sp. SA101]